MVVPDLRRDICILAASMSNYGSTTKCILGCSQLPLGKSCTILPIPPQLSKGDAEQSSRVAFYAQVEVKGRKGKQAYSNMKALWYATSCSSGW